MPYAPIGSSYGLDNHFDYQSPQANYSVSSKYIKDNNKEMRIAQYERQLQQIRSEKGETERKFGESRNENKELRKTLSEKEDKIQNLLQQISVLTRYKDFCNLLLYFKYDDNCIFLSLPRELLMIIFELFDLKILYILRQTCKDIKDICDYIIEQKKNKGLFDIERLIINSHLYDYEVSEINYNKNIEKLLSLYSHKFTLKNKNTTIDISLKNIEIKKNLFIEEEKENVVILDDISDDYLTTNEYYNEIWFKPLYICSICGNNESPEYVYMCSDIIEDLGDCGAILCNKCKENENHSKIHTLVSSLSGKKYNKISEINDWKCIAFITLRDIYKIYWLVNINPLSEKYGYVFQYSIQIAYRYMLCGISDLIKNPFKYIPK